MNRADREALRAYYAEFDESTRLEAAGGWLERERTLALFTAAVPAGSRVLDLGGGTGIYTVPLAARGDQVTLVDLAPRHIEAAAIALEREGLEAELLVGDALDPPVADGFDGVLSTGPLYHVGSDDELQRMLDTSARLLRPGGFFAGAFIPRTTGVSGLLARAASNPAQLAPGDLEATWSTGRFVNRGEQGFTHAWFAEPRQVVCAARRAGLSDVQVRSLRGLAAPYGAAVDVLRTTGRWPEVHNLIEATADRPDVIGMGWHALVTGYRTTDLSWTFARWNTLHRDDLLAAIRLRQDVFVVEQTCPYPDLDGVDDDAWHLLGFDGDALVAYLRVFGPGVRGPDAVIGRVITAPSVRGTGIGRTLMLQGHQRIRAHWGEVAVRLGAQVRQRGFYERLGYGVDGEGYDEDGIPHVPMRTRLGKGERRG